MTSGLDDRERLFMNARDSINMGITDFSSNSPTRAASGVRNFYAGLLLLAKYLLAMKAPTADLHLVIASRFEPVPNDNGGVDIVQKGHQTIDFNDIERRFKKFGLQIDKNAISELNRIRTDVEHYFTKEDPEAIREAMAKAFPFAISLFRLAGKDPAGELGDSWNILIEIKNVYEKELARCRESFSRVEWLSEVLANAPYNCPYCHSDLVMQDEPKWAHTHDGKCRCLACGQEIDHDVAIARALELHFEADSYAAALDGCEGPLDDCPECGVHAYIMTEVETGCANCGASLGSCARCECGLMPSNVDYDNHSFCSYCANLLYKDD